MREINRLSDAEVRNAKPDKGKFVKRLLDGAGLYLQATLSRSGGINRNWIFRYELDGQRHDLGVGPAHTVSLSEARRRASELRLQILDHIDPAQERADLKAERLGRIAAKLKATTFLQCWNAYFKIHAKTWKNPKHRAQWESTMRTYVLPVLGPLDVRHIETAHVEKVLAPIWDKIPETASRVQNRIKLVLAYAIAGGFRSSDNPAARDLVKARLGKIQRTNGHHAAAPYVQLPALMAELRKRDSMSARALEFTITCTTRTSETIGAVWDEIDLKKRLWVIPPERMKSGREHRIWLSDRAVELLKSLPHRGKHVFTGTNRKPLSNMAMLECLRGLSPGHTVHGTARSSFRDWATERTNIPEFIIEQQLAHAVGDETVKAYKRTDVIARRARLLKLWSDYLAKPVRAADTVDLDAERKKRRG
jgi:integrase